MTDIKPNHINDLSKVYHDLIFISQRSTEDFFSDNLKGITSLEISILELLHKKPDIIIREILEILRVPNSTLTNAINRLERRKLVKRVINERDRRSYGLQLTEVGVDAQNQHILYEKKLFASILEPLEEDERQNFIQSLAKIAEHFKNL